MVDSPKNGEQKAPQTHSEARRLFGNGLAAKFHNDFMTLTSNGAPTDAVKALFEEHTEEVLIHGERQGVQNALKVLDKIIDGFRRTMTHGVANHIEQARAIVQEWYIHDRGGNFKKFSQSEEPTKEP